MPDPSLLAKFRAQRLQEATLDDILTEIIRQCVEKGIIKGKSLSVDTTHILANTTKKVPERVMKHLAKEILSDEKFLLQKGVRSLSDKDARVGSKSKTDQFFGYKAEFFMTTDERLITAIDVHSGEYVDTYLFKKEQCKVCPHRDKCIGSKGGKKAARKLTVTTSAPLFYEKSQEQKTPEFRKKYKKRAAQEWKNGEMKRFHGMNRARGWGKRSVSFQAKFTAIAVNLKRIAALWRDMELAEAKAAKKPKRFPHAAPPDGSRRLTAPICWNNSALQRIHRHRAISFATNNPAGIPAGLFVAKTVKNP